MTEARNFADELAARETPAVGVWNRLEGRPRTVGFDRALRAEVRDPLWMLTRQWQLGELRGADAGSPVTVTYAVTPSRPTRFQPHEGTPRELAVDHPLETAAERRLPTLAYGTSGDEKVAFDLRLAIGRQWFKLMAAHSLLGALFRIKEDYLKRYPIALPAPGNPGDVAKLAHPEVWAMMQTIAGRAMDGHLFYLHLKGGGNAEDGTGVIGAVQRDLLRKLGRRLVRWYESLIERPEPADATWDPSRFEHRFSVAAGAPGGGEKKLSAKEYEGGTLDWHAFSVDPKNPLGGTKPPEPTLTRTVFPAPVRYSGMPLPRWWAQEDGKTNFAAVRTDSTDLARLVFLEFALVFSNDWYQVPCDLPAGTLAKVTGMVVTDVFGQKQAITPAGAGPDQDWRRWSMFTLDTIGDDDVQADTDLLLPPSVPKVTEGPALEEVLLIRDEAANMVWGIEQTVTTPIGEPRRGSEAAAEVVTFRRRLAEATEAADADPPRAPISYVLMNTVPEHWIPFIPVHEPGDHREIRLQRAAMPGVVDQKPVEPRTTLLRPGLDQPQPGQKPQYFVNEEEVTQAGTRLSVAYNRTRWRDGRVVVWLSARRGVGRGEGSSGLAFDQLVDTPLPPAP
ncbi:hypothetical protein [Amycolatopsis sp. BJA-103]|uniref:hypothetical protein n=1 Tax=unclassified Amycolatopsis TaxID=2618356 RepID=UPI000C778E74|nr:hypothetical protein [Amycolatopsis sp. BJA-103]AUI60642.1 hypothetical protein BKN51_22260 [Amycolatopsis sp. BJA-103]PNE16669.1 hypothetical protein B1H26_25910 [Amycolatopsis sp. BJA-103]